MILLLKKRIDIIFLIIVFFLSINLVGAASKTYNYIDINNAPLNNPKLYVYGCTDSSCSTLLTPYWNTPTSSSTSSITITGSPSSYNKEFRYVNCYKIGETISWYPLERCSWRQKLTNSL